MGPGGALCPHSTPGSGYSCSTCPHAPVSLPLSPKHAQPLVRVESRELPGGPPSGFCPWTLTTASGGCQARAPGPSAAAPPARHRGPREEPSTTRSRASRWAPQDQVPPPSPGPGLSPALSTGRRDFGRPRPSPPQGARGSPPRGSLPPSIPTPQEPRTLPCQAAAGGGASRRRKSFENRLGRAPEGSTPACREQDGVTGRRTEGRTEGSSEALRQWLWLRAPLGGCWVYCCFQAPNEEGAAPGPTGGVALAWPRPQLPSIRVSCEDNSSENALAPRAVSPRPHPFTSSGHSLGGGAGAGRGSVRRVPGVAQRAHTQGRCGGRSVFRAGNSPGGTRVGGPVANGWRTWEFPQLPCPLADGIPRR